MDPALSHLTVSPELALEFLAVFSRFEFALKVSNLRRPGDGEAKADWAVFAEAVADTFDPQRTAQLTHAFMYLTGEPLRHFAVENGALAWRPFNLPEGLSQAGRVVRLIKQVRNNLFHGGKFAPDPQAGSDRDSRLIQASLVVLRELLHLSPQVRAAYVD